MKLLLVVVVVLFASVSAQAYWSPPSYIQVPGVAGLPVFCTAAIHGDKIFLSGTLGTLNDTSPPTLVPGGVGPETTQALANIKWALTYIYDAPGLDVMQTVISCRVYLKDNDPQTFAIMNKAYAAAFSGGNGYPARMSFGGVTLALGAAVEIECVAAAPPNYDDVDSVRRH